MPKAFPLTCPRRLAAAAVLGLALILAAQSAGKAQTVVVFVNGEPITALDVAQRMKLIEVSTRKPAERQEALDELIDEKLKVQVGKKYGLEIPDKDVDNSFSTMARRMNQTAKQFTDALTKEGISVAALKRRIKADITWSSIIRGKFPSINAVGDKDIQDAHKSDGKETAASYLYTLREILFIVPRGSPPTAFEARRREAEGLRHRFENCQEGVPFARQLTDVAVRDEIHRSSAEIGAAQREVLDATAVGHLTPPETNQEGIDMFAVCARDSATGGDTLGMAQAREAMVAERYNARAKKYLEELRREAIIEPGH
ncbi:MAG TPA: SurA N-terminal domain-containing protein [Xanthobacteraceae bacterium]|nr:SurA N-terminal domain-containing protein [Xanthobacteraceae bacterium]